MRIAIRLSLVAVAAATVSALVPPAAAQAPDAATARLRAENDSLRRVIDSLRASLSGSRLAAPTAPQTELAIPARPTARHPGTVRTWFDSSISYSYATLESIRIGQFQVEAAYQTPGERLYAPGGVHLTFYANNREPQFTQCHSIDLVADGRPVRLSRTTYDVRGAAFEIIGADIPTSEFLSLVNASRAEGRICNTAFVIGAPELLALRDLASRMLPLPASARPE